MGAIDINRAQPHRARWRTAHACESAHESTHNWREPRGDISIHVSVEHLRRALALASVRCCAQRSLAPAAPSRAARERGPSAASGCSAAASGCTQRGWRRARRKSLQLLLQPQDDDQRARGQRGEPLGWEAADAGEEAALLRVELLDTRKMTRATALWWRRGGGCVLPA